MYRFGREPDWLREWAAKITLTLTIDEKTTLNPGVAMNNTPQTLGLSLGGIGASAECEQTMTWFVVFADYFPAVSRHVLKSELKPNVDRSDDKSYALKSDLKMRETLYSAVFVDPMDTISHPYKRGGPYDDISHRLVSSITSN